MSRAIKLGRVRGITIEIHASWLFAYFIALLVLASEIGPVAGRATAPIAAVTAFVFFASIVAHELGHALVALRLGVPVQSITLFVFGGVARIAREPKTPADELAIAIAGPLVSAAIGAAALAASRIVPLPPIAAVPLAWIGRVNLGLAVFNCLPGFPLDGGRILRAAVWYFRKDFLSATVTSARVGAGLGWTLVLLGVLGAMGGRIADGLWIGFVGWFLTKAAAASASDAILRSSVEGSTAADAMSVEPPAVPPSLSIEQYVLSVVFVTGRRAHLVRDEGGVHGVVTFERALAVPRERWSTTAIAYVAAPLAAIPRIPPQTPLLDAVDALADAPLAIVADGARTFGVVERDHVLALLSARAEASTRRPRRISPPIHAT